MHALDHRLEQLPKDVALTKAAVAIDRESRVMEYLVVESEATEPTIGEVKLDGYCYGHPQHEFRTIEGRPASL